MDDGGGPRRTPDLCRALYYGGELQADGHQRNGDRHRDGGFPRAPCSGLGRGGVRARSHRVLPHRRLFFGSSAAGRSLCRVSRLRVPRAVALGGKPGRVRIVHRSFHVCCGPSVCGRAWPRTRVGDEARMAQAVIARSRQSIVIRASTTVMLVGCSFSSPRLISGASTRTSDHMKQVLWGLAFLWISFAAHAQYPNKPVRVVVPFPAGSSTNIVTRVLANSVSQSIDQQLVVDNKAGADGAIAAAEVAKAAPDGYTLLMATNSPMSALPAMNKSPPYDPVADFTPITDIGRYTFFILVHPSVQAKTLAELIDHARANPGKLNYATGNTTSIVSTAYFASLAGIQLVHVPYKGEPQAVTDLVAGRVQLMFCSSSTSIAQIRNGRLRALVTTLGKRSHMLPEVPTIAEAGMPQFSITSWAGLFGPARMPREVVERLNKEFGAAMARAEVQAAMEKQAFALTPSSPEQLAAFVKEQMESYRRILRAAGVEPE